MSQRLLEITPGAGVTYTLIEWLLGARLELGEGEREGTVVRKKEKGGGKRSLVSRGAVFGGFDYAL